MDRVTGRRCEAEGVFTVLLLVLWLLAFLTFQDFIDDKGPTDE